MFIVLTLKGKSAGRADTVSVKIFPEKYQAQEFCKTNDSLTGKYWVSCQIVDEDELVYTDRPEID